MIAPNPRPLLLDSNVLIDASRPGAGALVRYFSRPHVYISTATVVEVLGFHSLNRQELRFLRNGIWPMTILPITNKITGRAVALRQVRRMSLGDALIAATALIHDLPLATRNVRDFAWIGGLEVVNPLA